jgi:hypothetical protein
MCYSTLREPALSKLKQITQADLVLGLPTHFVEPYVASQVAEQAIAGAKKYYPSLRTVLINVDIGRKCEIRQAIQATALSDVQVITGRYCGVLGRGAAVSAILHGALELQAKVIILLDSRTETFAPAWIPGLATFVLNNQADLVKPRYDLPFPDSALNDLLFYPFTRAVWGVNLHHPTASDYALSANLARIVLTQDVWETEISRGGFDIWLSTFAAVEKWRLAQAALGIKNYQTQSLSMQVPTDFKEAIGTMLYQLTIQRHLWPHIKQVRSLPTLTEFASRGDHSATPQNDPSEDIEALMLGWMEYRSLWQKVMLPENLAAVEHLASQPIDQFQFPPDPWAKIVYDFAVVFNKGDVDPDTVVTALYPLYRGRLAGFWPEIAGLTAIGRAGTVAAQGVEFEEHRPYLERRWKSYTP